MTVGEVMTRDVVVARPEETVVEVARRMVDSGHASLPVIDDGRRVVGMISEADLIRLVIPRYVDMLEDVSFLPPELDFIVLDQTQPLGSVQVEQVMRREPLYTVQEDTPLVEAALLILHHRIRRLPVVRDGQLVGIISRGDIVRAIVRPTLEEEV